MRYFLFTLFFFIFFITSASALAQLTPGDPGNFITTWKKPEFQKVIITKNTLQLTPPRDPEQS